MKEAYSKICKLQQNWSWAIGSCKEIFLVTGCKESYYYSFPFRQPVACTSPKWWALVYSSSEISNSPKKRYMPMIGKLRTEFTRVLAKSTSLWVNFIKPVYLLFLDPKTIAALVNYACKSFINWPPSYRAWLYLHVESSVVLYLSIIQPKTKKFGFKNIS